MEWNKCNFLVEIGPFDFSIYIFSVHIFNLFQDIFMMQSYWCRPLFNGLEVLSSASVKAKLFAENFSKNSNLDDSGISLPDFHSRTNLKLHNICVSPKMVKKVIMNLDLSKASGPDCIPVVVLKNCEPELSYIIAELFKSVWRSLVFQIIERFHWWSLYLRMLGKVYIELKFTALLVFFLWLVKSLKHLNNRIVDHLEKFFLISSMALGLLSQLPIFCRSSGPGLPEL